MSLRFRLPRLVHWVLLAAVLLMSAGMVWPPKPALAGLSFVDGHGTPLAGATVRILCYSSSSGAAPFSDTLATTDQSGAVLGSLPSGCNDIAALNRIYSQPSGKPGHGSAYDVYMTSWPAGGSQPLAATGTISLSNPLGLFNVVASLEWQPATNSQFASDLWQGLRHASGYLYNLTEGQMAFGNVTISAGGTNWDGADYRFLAADDVRPAAFVGGIVPARTAYTPTKTLSETVYAPGEIYLGRFWNGVDASNPISGTWLMPNAYRTLVHEWGHYGLFLYDEYQRLTSTVASTYCVDTGLPITTSLTAASAMAYHYTADKLWSGGPAIPIPDACLNTAQMRVHGESDWETLQKWTAIQGIQGLPDPFLTPPSLPIADLSSSLTDALFGHQAPSQYALYLPAVQGAGPSAPPVSEPAIRLMLSNTSILTDVNAVYPQVYLSGTILSPARIIYEGTTDSTRTPPDNLGQIVLFGVQAGDQARVFLDKYGPAGKVRGRFVGGSSQLLMNGQTLQVAPDTTGTWNLYVDYGFTGPQLTVMTVTLTSTTTLPVTPLAQLCTPDAATVCPNMWRELMSGAGSMWSATFTATPGTELPNHGVVRVQVPGLGDMMRWFQVSGGVGPAHINGDAPLADAPVMVQAVPQLQSNQFDRVAFMPAADYNAVAADLPAGIGGIVGYPIDVNVLLPGSSPSGLGFHFLPISVTLTLFYSQEAVDRLGITKDKLTLLHFGRAPDDAPGWIEVTPSGSDPILNWLATGPVRWDGIYAVGWKIP